ncbi:hypothetical protein [Cryptosporangium phraense]|uniref:Uncharacterized protein n=1 Tax=Cryptosporangium phraense TaxID=2593070 RepID=A0A545AF81_9ACTN|nr:hypothetical protein [Cryptosporangium phraense]TQS39987.1 hypothetical protein FL583_37200 [Cryptosporangium phraense]
MRAADRRALVDRVPLDRQPPLPKRTPGTALDDVHRNSIIQINRDEPAPASDRWFKANNEDDTPTSI